MTFDCRVPKWNSLLFCVLYLCWVRILYFEMYLVVVLKWKGPERKQSFQRFIFIVRHYIWKNVTSLVVLVKPPRIFWAQVKWCHNSKNDRVAIFIEMIVFFEEFALKGLSEILLSCGNSNSCNFLSASISWVIFHFYTYLQYSISCNVFMWHFYSGK